MTRVIGHRGAPRRDRENTVAGFRTAARLGCDGIELDVRRTSDGRLVVHHDPVLADGRTIVATPFAELPDHVPTLEAALDACAGVAVVNVEIKNDPREPDFDDSEGVAAATVAALLHRRSERFLISSFRRATIDRCRAIAPELPTAFLCTQPPPGVLRDLARAGHAAIHPYYSAIDGAFIGEAHAEGVEVNVWTCDDPDAMRLLIDAGVDGICTNVPDLALELLGR
ncbi:MAG: glycerophosphodiester phosphodiesterase [Ilumatobacteraceae bacterium]